MITREEMLEGAKTVEELKEYLREEKQINDIRALMQKNMLEATIETVDAVMRRLAEFKEALEGTKFY